MNEFLVAAYVLVWPLIVAVMLFVMGRGVLRDMRRAKRRGEDLV